MSKALKYENMSKKEEECWGVKKRSMKPKPQEDSANKKL